MSTGRLDIMTDRLERIAAVLILVLVLAFVLGLTVSAYLGTSILNMDDVSGENIEFYEDNIFLNLILLVLFLSALYLFCRHCDHIRIRRMEALLLCWYFCFGTAFIVSTKLRAPVYSDSFLVTYGAQRASLGDYAMLSENYFRRFPFQLGYVLYSEVFFRVMNVLLRGRPEGYAVLALQEVNLLWLMLQMHALIEITGLLFSDGRVRKLMMLLSFFCLPPLLMITFLYGNVPAYACGTLAVWMYLLYEKKERVLYALLCMITLTLAVTLKLNLLIFLVAIGGIWLLRSIRRRSLKSLLCLMLTVACVLTVKGLPQKIYEKRIGIDYGDGIPMIAWMAMGFDEGHAAPGWYREEHTVTAFEETNYDPEATAALAKEALSERVGEFSAHPRLALRFFGDKLRSQWNEPSYGSLWLNQVQLSYSEKGAFYRFVCESGSKRTFAVMNQFQQLVFLGVLIALIRLLKKKDLLRSLLPLILLGGLLYHLLFEAKSQYAMPYFLLMLPLAAYGFFRLFRKIELR